LQRAVNVGRGSFRSSKLDERQVVHRQIAQADLKLRATRALMQERYGQYAGASRFLKHRLTYKENRIYSDRERHSYHPKGNISNAKRSTISFARTIDAIKSRWFSTSRPGHLDK
jgi:hypothetical protein